MGGRVGALTPKKNFCRPQNAKLSEGALTSFTHIGDHKVGHVT